MIKKIYYISNTTSHKIINILGIRIKLPLSSNIKKKGLIVLGYNNILVNIINNIEKPINRPLKGINIEVVGNNNRVIINSDLSHFKNDKIIINGDNNLVKIGSCKYLIENTIFDMRVAGTNREIIIDNDFSSNGAVIWNKESCSKIIIGKGVMLGHNIFIRNGDGHLIFDKYGNHTNRARKIEIKDHVWIGAFVSILKNVEIPQNTIIGTHSLVTKTFLEENTIIAGNPAKIIKRDITWERTTPNLYYAQLERDSQCMD